jgi:hypothetical protein
MSENNITNNYIYGYNFGVMVQGNTTKSFVFLNNILNTFYAGIKICENSSDSYTFNNYIFNSVNCISLKSNSTLNFVNNNNLTNCIIGIALTNKGNYNNSFYQNSFFNNSRDIYIDTSFNYIYNLTSSFITNGTGLCNNTEGLTTGNVNITLNPSESCYILNNFNITEGVQREYSPYNATSGKITGFADEITLPVYGANTYRNATLSSGTRITNTEANITLKPNAEVYIYNG